ncbi:MAG: hypothetical protein ACREVL_14260 [Solimonas sp.]
MALAIAAALETANQQEQTSNSNESSENNSGERVAFGQKRISANFSNGTAITAVAASIAAGERPPVEVTRFHGQLSAVNNRTLAAYGIAGIRPTNLIETDFHDLPGEVQARFYESNVPNFLIPVTAGKMDMTPIMQIPAPP